MTPTELRAALSGLGHSQVSFAKLIGASDRTVRRWATGEQNVPAWVPLLLRLLAQTERVSA
jgi:DNA-binding transcriptional regulator YiaG